jgi:hypothetical protein
MKRIDRNAKTVIELLMEIVAPITGGITVAMVLKSLTTLPTWGCVLIALPVGTILGWATILGVLFALGAIVQAGQNWRTYKGLDSASLF